MTAHSPLSGMTRAVVVGCAVLGLVVAMPTAALAIFTASASAGGLAASSATLNPVTGLASTTGCVGKAPFVNLTWTPTTSGYATGYTVLRTSGATTTTVATLSTAATTYRDSTVATGTSYSYTVRVTYRSWTANATTTRATQNRC